MGCCCCKAAGGVVDADTFDKSASPDEGNYASGGKGGPGSANGANSSGGKGGKGPGGMAGLFKVLKLGAVTGGRGGAGAVDANGVPIHGSSGADGGADGAAPGTAEEHYEEVTSTSAVKVMVVVRPMLEFEKKNNATDIVTLTSPTQIKLPNKPNGSSATDNGYKFDFDRVYRTDTPAVNHRLFSEMVKPLVDRFCQGFNCTVLAYGQTGSGKTFTMGTAAGRQDVLSKEPKGLIPQLMAVVFAYMKAASPTYEVTLKVSYVEIYNEALNDLLVKPHAPSASASGKVSPAPPKLEIRESPDGEIYIEGAVQVTADNREALAQMLEAGNTARSVASHKLNEQSSRSHAIVTVHMDQRAKPAAFKSVPAELRFLRSKLHLVDLAGSERAKETGATGDRFAEGVSINKGLLELGNVINALTEAKGKQHVPYRNSKLTRVLQDSLGGNSETLFIACVSPADSNHDHSLNTLRYASRARNIKNNLRMNAGLSTEEELEYLRGMVAKLTAEVQELREKYDPAVPPHFDA